MAALATALCKQKNERCGSKSSNYRIALFNLYVLEPGKLPTTITNKQHLLRLYVSILRLVPITDPVLNAGDPAA
jgi:hypothetical protein